MIKIEVYKCKLSEVACLAPQSSRSLVPAVQSIPLPRRLRQRSRLNVKQATQTITTPTQASSQHYKATAHIKQHKVVLI